MTYPDEPDVEVIVLEPGEWDQAVNTALAELGITYDELEAMAAERDFTSPRALKLWLAIGPRRKPSTPSAG